MVEGNRALSQKFASALVTWLAIKPLLFHESRFNVLQAWLSTIVDR